MSPIAQKLLSIAFANYQKTGDEYFEYISPNSDDWLYALEGARQLQEDGLIDSDLSYVADRSIRSVPGNIPPITFGLTQEAIDKLLRERDMKG